MKLRDYQEDASDAVFEQFKERDKTLVVMPTGTGKCLAKGTPVLKFDGTVAPAEDIKVGDILIGPDSKERIVTSICSGSEMMYRIVPTKGDPFTVNESHILSLMRTNEGPVGGFKCERRGGYIENVSVGEYLAKSKTFKHTRKLWRTGVEWKPDIDPLFIDPYFLGLWLGDGNSRQPSITTGDPEIVEYVKRYAESIETSTRIEPNSENSVNVHVAGRIKGKRSRLKNALRYYRLILNKHIPLCYKIAPESDRLALLAGIIDTDGYRNKANGLQLVLASERLFDDVLFLARSLGFACYKSKVKKTCTNNGVVGDYFSCCISGNLDRIPCLLPRKKFTPRAQKKNHLVTGFTVSKVGVGSYYGFTISGTDRLFLLGDFTVTHNTILFANVIERMHPQRAIVLAHREELIFQARDKIERVTGLNCEIEMAHLSVQPNMFNKADVVVSTIQTQIAGAKGGRMNRFDPNNFGLLIIDEAHHATAASYRKVIDYYRTNPFLKVLGVTATPDRTDEEALGQIFETVAFDYEILDAINDGWLVPIEQQMVTIQNLDFSHVRTTAGDLNGADLAAVMEAEENIQGIASASINIIGERRAIVFTASVKHAETISEIFNRHRSGMADWVYANTPKDKRKSILADFAAGKIQVVCNCGVLTEGFDDPGVEVIIMGRPTKSRSLYAQMVGRSTRPLAGVVDLWPTPDERRSSIEKSPKKSCLVVDFVGNSGRHKLITSADILGGNVSDEAIELAVREAREKGTAVPMAIALSEAEAKLRAEAERRKQFDVARRARLVAKVTFNSQKIDPFDVLQIEPLKSRGWDSPSSLSEKQRGLLQKSGFNPDELPGNQAKQLIGELCRRWKNGLCTFKQAKLLRKHGYDTAELTMKDASKLIDALAKNHWQRPPEPPSKPAVSVPRD